MRLTAWGGLPLRVEIFDSEINQVTIQWNHLLKKDVMVRTVLSKYNKPKQYLNYDMIICKMEDRGVSVACFQERYCHAYTSDDRHSLANKSTSLNQGANLPNCIWSWEKANY